MSGFLYWWSAGRADYAGLKDAAHSAGYREEAVPLGRLFVRGPSIDTVTSSPSLTLIRHGEWLDDSDLAELVTTPSARLSHWQESRGSLLCVNAKTGCVIVSTDVAGSFPVFCWHSGVGDEIVVGSSFSEMRSLVSAEADDLGVYQFLTKGYTVGVRTLAKEVHQLGPAQVQLYTRHPGGIRSECQDHSRLWKTESEVSSGKLLLDELTEIWRTEARKFKRAQLMMSAGWDSRTLLAGALAANKQGEMHAYSHGDIRGRELRLAARICDTAGIPYIPRQLPQDAYTPDFAEWILGQVDTFVFPHWGKASEYGREQGRAQIVAGIFGGVVGGHYGVTSVGSARQRGRALLWYLAGKADPANGIPSDVYARARSLLADERYYRLWCIKDDIHDSMEQCLFHGNVDDVSRTIQGGMESGIATVEGLVEWFQVLQRGRQYMNGQLLSGSAALRVLNPYTHPRFMTLACAVPLSDKVHNKLNRRLLQRLAPSLLKFPMAATLVPAGMPVPLQEMSRAVRKSLEGMQWKAHHATRGRVPRPHLSWVDFQFLAKSGALHDLVDSLRLDIWDKRRMHDTVRLASGSLHPLFDMLAKCKTLDFRLTRRFIG